MNYELSKRIKFRRYFTLVVLRTKEQTEWFAVSGDRSRVCIVDNSISSAWSVDILNAFLFKQWRAFIHIRISEVDTDMFLFFDIIHITFNYGLR